MSVSFDQAEFQTKYSEAIWAGLNASQKMRVTKTQSEDEANKKFKAANSADKFGYTREYQ